MENEKTENIVLSGVPNIDRETRGMSRVDKNMIDTIIIPLDEYRELLSLKGRYEELKDICNNKLTSPILRPEVTPLHNPYIPGMRSKSMEEQNENHIPGV